MEQSKVLQALISERTYQDEQSANVDAPHMIEDFTIAHGIAAMEYNLQQARDVWYSSAPNYSMPMEFVRKIGGIAVKLGERYGMNPRENDDRNFCIETLSPGPVDIRSFIKVSNPNEIFIGSQSNYIRINENYAEINGVTSHVNEELIVETVDLLRSNLSAGIRDQQKEIGALEVVNEVLNYKSSQKGQFPEKNENFENFIKNLEEKYTFLKK